MYHNVYIIQSGNKAKCDKGSILQFVNNKNTSNIDHQVTFHLKEREKLNVTTTFNN